MKTIEEIEKEIEEVWNGVCDSEESLEFNKRQKAFIKTKELQAQFRILKDDVKLIDEVEKQDWSTHKEDMGLVRAIFFDLKQKIQGKSFASNVKGEGK